MVKLYSSPTCGKCRVLKTWMKNNGIAYTEVDVEADDDARTDLMSEGLVNLPVVKIDETYYNDYQQIQKVIKEFSK